MKSFLFIPVVNHFNLLEQAIKSVHEGVVDEYIVYNNSGKPLTCNVGHFTIHNNEGKRKTFRETQNIMRQYAIDNGCSYYLFMHNDGEIMDEDTLERLVKLAETKTDPWGVIFTHYDVLCAYNVEAVKHIGEWGDAEWPAAQLNGYCLDNDYYRRMKLSGFPEVQLEDSHVDHREFSNTIKNEVEHFKWVRVMDKVYDHYRKKWGGDPGKETITIVAGNSQ
jgi:hypothetical protein